MLGNRNMRPDLETLLGAVTNNEPLPFMRADQFEAACPMLMSVFKAWAETCLRNFPDFAADTWGPEDTHLLLEPVSHWSKPPESRVSGVDGPPVLVQKARR
jgi:glucose-6-phosphate 1-dehydrogenase